MTTVIQSPFPNWIETLAPVDPTLYDLKWAAVKGYLDAATAPCSGPALTD